MCAKRGQVALYVLIGVVLLVGVAIAIHVVSQQRVATNAESTIEDTGLSPACQAEKARVAERVAQCFKRKSADVLDDFNNGDYDTLPQSSEELATFLAGEIESELVDCFSQFNLEGRVPPPPEPPKVSVLFGDQSVTVSFKGVLAGSCGDEAYHISPDPVTIDFPGKVYTESLPLAQELASALAGDAESSWVSDGALNLYAHADKHLFADVVVTDEGCVAYLTSTAPLFKGKDTVLFPPVEVPNCVYKPSDFPEATSW